MPEQLKIVIDADVSKGIAGVKEISKVISSDFAKATSVASSAAFDLSKSVAQATARIDSSIDKMVEDALKGTSDISKAFSSIGTVKLGSSNVLATLDEIKAKLSGLDVSIQIKTFGIDKLNTDIAQAKEQLSTLLGKELTINLDATNALQKIKLLEVELKDLKGLSLSPNISSTQFELFKKNIDTVQAKILSLKSTSNFVLRADNSQLIQSFGEVQARLTRLSSTIKGTFSNAGGFAKFHSELGKSTAAISTLEKRGAGINNFFKSVAVSSGQAANSLSRLPNSANQATLAMMNLGRVVQDAPFGFLGIANNLNPLLESFERLKQTSGTTGKALKAVAGSLLGAGGLGFAVSVASSLLISFGSRLFSSGKKAEEAKREISDFSQAVRDAGKAFSDSAIKATSLVSALSGNNLNLSERKAALKELQGINQEFFGSLKEEDGLIKGLQVAYDGYLARLKEIGKTKAIESQLTKLFDKKLQLELSIDPKFISQTDASVQRVLGRLQNELNSLGGPLDIAKEKFDAFNKTQARRIELQQKINTLQGGQQVRLLGEGFGARIQEINQLELRINALSNLLKTDGKFDINIPTPDTKNLDDLLARARQFVKEFGDIFVLPDLSDSFFTTEKDLKKAAKGLLDNVKKFIEGDVSALKLRIPVVTEFDFLPTEFQLTQDQIDGFFKNVGNELKIPIEVIPDLSLAKGNLDLILKKLDLRKQFSIFGDLGFKEFDKIDFSNLNKGLQEGTKLFQGMLDIANTLSQALGQGVVGAFNSVFDAILEGKNVFKALANAVKDLVVQTIKAIAQMLILKAIKSFIFPGLPGGGSPFFLPGSGGLTANRFNLGGAVGSRSFDGAININVNGQISGDVIRLAGQRAASSAGRFG